MRLLAWQADDRFKVFDEGVNADRTYYARFTFDTHYYPEEERRRAARGAASDSEVAPKAQPPEYQKKKDVASQSKERKVNALYAETQREIITAASAKGVAATGGIAAPGAALPA